MNESLLSFGFEEEKRKKIRDFLYKTSFQII